MGEGGEMTQSGQDIGAVKQQERSELGAKHGASIGRGISSVSKAQKEIHLNSFPNMCLDIIIEK